MIDRVFRLDEHGTTISKEIAGGVTTYLAMAYIAIVNPQILADAGMDQGAVFVATCLATAIACAAMGLYANYPIALAPGMGINAFFTYGVVLAVVGLILIAALDALKKTGAILIGILAVTAAGLLVGEVNWQGTVSAVPSLAPTFLRLDIGAAFDMVFFGVIFAFLFTDLFDTSGTLIAVARQGELLDGEGNLPRLKQAVIVDSGASMLGSLLGTSSVTSYVESAAGVKVGGRTGLGAVTVAVLFLLTLFLSPLAATIPPFATAAALLFVACVMIRNMTGIDWDDATEYVPAVVLAVTIPFSFSIANGIAAGFITYAAIKLVSGRFRQLKPAVGTLAVLFVAKIAFLGA